MTEGLNVEYKILLLWHCFFGVIVEDETLVDRKSFGFVFQTEFKFKFPCCVEILCEGVLNEFTEIAMKARQITDMNKNLIFMLERVTVLIRKSLLMW